MERYSVNPRLMIAVSKCFKETIHVRIASCSISLQVQLFKYLAPWEYHKQVITRRKSASCFSRVCTSNSFLKPCCSRWHHNHTAKETKEKNMSLRSSSFKTAAPNMKSASSCFLTIIEKTTACHIHSHRRNSGYRRACHSFSQDHTLCKPQQHP